MIIIRALIAGGGAPEIEVSIKLSEHARTLTGMEAYCVRAFAEALEVIPYTLSENAGLNPIATVTELRNRHAKGETTAGINVRKVRNWEKNFIETRKRSVTVQLKVFGKRLELYFVARFSLQWLYMEKSVLRCPTRSVL